MVDKFRATGRYVGNTGLKIFEDACIVIALLAAAAAAVGVASKPSVATAMGIVPFWQGVAGVLAVVIVGYIGTLVYKRG